MIRNFYSCNSSLVAQGNSPALRQAWANVFAGGLDHTYSRAIIDDAVRMIQRHLVLLQLNQPLHRPAANWSAPLLKALVLLLCQDVVALERVAEVGSTGDREPWTARRMRQLLQYVAQRLKIIWLKSGQTSARLAMTK
jgi:predicted O-methyltransferase YrrM